MSPLRALVLLPFLVALRPASVGASSGAPEKAKIALAAACRAGNCYDDALVKRGGFAARDLAAAESAWLCETGRHACASVRRAVDGLVMADAALAQCRLGRCPPEALSSACRGVSDGRDYSTDDSDDELAGAYARLWLSELEPALDAVVSGKLGDGLDASEAELAELDSALGKASSGSADVADLSRRMTVADSKWRSASRSVNSCKAKTPSVERMNAVARGLAASGARLKALRVARGLAADLFPEPASAEVQVAATGGGAPTPAPGVAANRPRRDFLALSSALQSPPKVTEPGPLTIRQKGVPAPSKEEEAEAARIQTLRDQGKTFLIGDPAGRAALVHAQKGQDCVIVSQQQILIMAGLMSNADPEAGEETLQQEAYAKGYHDQAWGTLPEQNGALLLDKGFLVTRTDDAGPDRLDAAVRTGRPVLVTVDGRLLWSEAGRAVLGHMIVVTGAISDRGTGKILGYYVNDSAAPPAGARFIPAAAFLEMWRTAGGQMEAIQ